MPDRHSRAASIALPPLRLVARVLLRSAYRLRVRGFESVPAEGPAILVYNHVSFHDWLLVAAASPRLPRFVMHHYHFRFGALRWFFELFRAIPIAPKKEDPARLAGAMAAIDEALAAGELVAIAPEGGMTPDGTLQTFRPGVERIARQSGVPVVPIAIDGLWGSVFSRDGGEPMTKLPKRFRARVALTAASPVPAERVSADGLRSRIASMLGEHIVPARAGTLPTPPVRRSGALCRRLRSVRTY